MPLKAIGDAPVPGMRTNSWTGSVRLGGAGRANLNNYQVSLRDSSLVIHGGVVIVRRAHADRAAVQLDVFEDIPHSLSPRFATLPFRRCSLRRFEERFRRGVVRRRAEPRHGLSDATGARAALESPRGASDALVVMKREAPVARGIFAADGLLDRVNRELLREGMPAKIRADQVSGRTSDVFA